MTTDRQCRRLYRWEGTWRRWDSAQLTLPACRALVRSLCRLYRIPVPTVRFKLWCTWYDPEVHQIVLGRAGRNWAICAHEVAHAVLFHFTGERFEDHGPQFLAVYLYLLQRVDAAPMIALKASMVPFRLRVANVESHAPARIRKTYRLLWRTRH